MSGTSLFRQRHQMLSHQFTRNGSQTTTYSLVRQNNQKHKRKILKLWLSHQKCHLKAIKKNSNITIIEGRVRLRLPSKWSFWSNKSMCLEIQLALKKTSTKSALTLSLRNRTNNSLKRVWHRKPKKLANSEFWLTIKFFNQLNLSKQTN